MKKTRVSKQTKTEISQSEKITLEGVYENVRKLNIVVVVLTIAVAIVFVRDFVLVGNGNKVLSAAINPTPTEEATEDQLPVVDKYPSIEQTDYVRGDSKAQYVLVTFTDLECPYCKRFHSTAQEFLQKHTDIAWVFRNMPLPQLHPQAPDEAIAVECVGKIAGSETFWKFVDKIFALTPSNNGLNLAQLPVYAGEVGVDETAFTNCYSNKETENIVSVQTKQGEEYGISGTPGSFLINTKTKKAVLIPGAYPLEQLEIAFNKIK